MRKEIELGAATILAICLSGPFSPAAVAAAPRQIAVGDGTADGTHLQPYENAWVYSARKPGGTEHAQGIWSDHFAKTTVNGKSVWRRLQGMTYVNHLTSSVSDTFDPITCQALSNEQHHPDGTILKRTFDGAHVTTERLANVSATGKTTKFDLPAPVFDFYGGGYGIILSCLPLKVGYSGTLPSISETEDKAKDATFQVLRKERISAGSRGMRETFVVEVDTPGEYFQTFWLAKDPPYIIRLRVEWADKSAVATFNMI